MSDELDPQPEIRVTAHVLDNAEALEQVLGRAEDSKVFDWDVLLDPESPLIQQPVELANYIRDLDGEAFRMNIAENRLLSSDHWWAYWAVGLYFEHIKAVGREDWPTAKRTLEQVSKQIGHGRIYNTRRLGDLVYGLAAGGLAPSTYDEVEDFVRYLLPREQADAIMNRIEVRRPSMSWRARFYRWALNKVQEQKGVDAGLPKPVTVPTMTQQFGPRENHGLKD